jgi:hypothetical protein
MTSPSDPRRRLVHLARWRAKRDGVPCTVTFRDFDFPRFCPALGIPLRVAQGRVSDHSPTLDRIVPDLGYVPGNVIVVSWRANRIKSDSSPSELRRIASFYTQLTPRK